LRDSLVTCSNPCLIYTSLQHPMLHRPWRCLRVSVLKSGKSHRDIFIALDVHIVHVVHCSAAQADGIEAYDCYYKDTVLLVPWLFGLPGDNPMQSELCSHIGMSGNLFCRTCKVNRASKTGTGKNVKIRSDEELLTDFLKVCSFRFVRQIS
jgi:hypothetical protein